MVNRQINNNNPTTKQSEMDEEDGGVTWTLPWTAMMTEREADATFEQSGEGPKFARTLLAFTIIW